MPRKSTFETTVFSDRVQTFFPRQRHLPRHKMLRHEMSQDIKD